MGGSKSSNISTSAPVVSSFRLQTSGKGRVIPVGYGKARLTPNLIDYQDFTAVPHTETTTSGGGGKGGGGGSVTQTNTTYTYTVAVLMALCHGQVASVPRCWIEKAQHTDLGALGLSIYNGSPVQTPFGYMLTAHPERAVGYRNICYVAAGSYSLGDTGTLANHSFEVDFGSGFSGSIRDALPSTIISDVLTNVRYGAGFPSSAIADMTVFADYCAASGVFLSPVYTEPSTAQSVVLELAELCDAYAYFSGGKLRFMPRADDVVSGNGKTFTPDLIPVYDLSNEDFLEPLRLVRNSNADAPNSVTLKFSNRDTDYNEEVAEATDQANVELFGLRKSPDIDAPAVVSASVAARVAQLTLQRNLYTRNKYELRIGWKYLLLEETDIVTLTDPALGLDRQAVRILSVEEDEWGELSCTAEELLIGVAQPAEYEQLYSDAYSHDYNAPADDCAAPVFVELESSQWRPQDDISLGIAVAGSGSNWGGATVWVSWDGANYEAIGKVTAPCRYGTLTSNVGSGINSAAPVTLVGNNPTLTSASTAAADKLATLCLVGDELCAYSTATLLGAGQYSLNLRSRGSYGTVATTHNTADRWVRLDNAVIWENIPYDRAGSTIYVKLTAYNIHGGGEQSLADVDPYTFPITGQPPSSVTGFSASAGTDAVRLSWDAVPNRDAIGYEIRQGASWASGAFVAHVTVPVTEYAASGAYTGSRTYWISAFDSVGNFSQAPVSVSFAVAAPAAPTITRIDVIDNNVLIYWQGNPATFPIATYQLRRGEAWAAATVIGYKDGAFTTVFEQIAGTYKYWLAATDMAGNVGAPSYKTAVVDQPPDYIFFTTIDSTFSGSKANALLSGADLLLPINTTETWGEHFTSRGWSSPADQIAAGYPIYIQPTPATASYTETIDYGTVLPNFKVSVLFDRVDLFAGASVGVELSTSADGVTFSSPVTASAAFFNNFRYLKVTLTATGDGFGLLSLSNLSIKLDAKRKVWGGSVDCNASDSGGTLVYLTHDGTSTGQPVFIDIISLIPGAIGVSNVSPVFDFVDTPYPHSFKALLFNSSTGARVSGTVHYSATGVPYNG